MGALSQQDESSCFSQGPTRVTPKRTTKPKSDFWKHYEHPLWQKKRQEILTRDNYTCQTCYGTESQLHVDHAYYISGRKPWQYPNWSLTTLCKECHKGKHEVADDDEPREEWEDAMGFLLIGTTLPHVGLAGVWDIACQIGMMISALNKQGVTGGTALAQLVHALTEMREGIEGE